MASQRPRVVESDEEENIVFARKKPNPAPSGRGATAQNAKNADSANSLNSRIANLSSTEFSSSVKTETNGGVSRAKVEATPKEVARNASHETKSPVNKAPPALNPSAQEGRRATSTPNSRVVKAAPSNPSPSPKKPKTEPQTPVVPSKPANGRPKPGAKKENPTPNSDSEDDKPLLSRVAAQPPSKANTPSVDTKKRPPDQVLPKQNGSAKKTKTTPSPKQVARTYESSGEEDEPTASDEDEDFEDDDEDDDVPLSARKQQRTPNSAERKRNSTESRTPRSKSVTGNSDVKWTTLVHNGVIFPPEYTPHGVKMLYDKKPVYLTPEQEEVATMYAVMRETEYVTKPIFQNNFWNDWKEILGPNHVIQKLELCDFTPIWDWHVAEKEKKKNISAEEKKRIKEEKLQLEEKYMWALVDGIREKVGNFRVEPPGLFRGRGEHPKMGKLKKRIYPENIVINIGKGAPVPECPIPGHRWKEVRHDNTVTWLAYWNDPINVKECKYVFLAPSSTLKGQSDREKYEKARKLKDYIVDIRTTYTRNFKSDDIKKRQIAVATYLIDRLALRAGNEKDDDEADTVGCCSLKVGHVKLVPPRSLEFDFLGKDSIRYFNTVEVEPEVYKAVGDFQKRKKPDDDIFDKLDTSKLNAHLKEIMPSLTAKVFRTYNASITLDRLLQDTTGSTVQEKVADYQRANKEVAILCNHQRSVSKAHATQMEKLEAKMEELKATISELEDELINPKNKKRDSNGNIKKALSPEAIEKKIQTATNRLNKMKLDREIKDDMKTVALGTSKINYMDPRITVAWCKRHSVPIERIFNKSLIAKFVWAMDVEPDYRF